MYFRPILMLLQAVSSTKAQRINLRVNKRIGLLERGKSANIAEKSAEIVCGEN